LETFIPDFGFFLIGALPGLVMPHPVLRNALLGPFAILRSFLFGEAFFHI
jgi:hypothetical protein